MEFLIMQVTDGGIADLAEVMRQDFRRESDSDTFCALCQQQRIFHRQGDRFLVASVIAQLPLRGLGIKHGVEGKLRESGLDISWGCGFVACQDVTPVSLRVDEQVLLSQLDQRIPDRGVAVRVELHGVTHNVRHFIVSAVVHAFHGVHDTALHGLEAIFDIGYGTLQDYIRGVIQEPVLVHARQMVYRCRIETVHGFIVGVALYAPL